MQCTTCKDYKSNGEVVEGKFICTQCIVSGLAKKVLKKRHAKESTIISVLKYYGVPGDIALGFYNNREIKLEYMIKMVWLMRYKLSQGYRIGNQNAFLQALIRNGNKHPLPDGFWDYHKERLNNPKRNDFDILYRPI